MTMIIDGNPGNGIGNDDINISDDEAEALGSLFLSDDSDPAEDNRKADDDDVEEQPETADDEDNSDDETDESGEDNADDVDGEQAIDELISLADVNRRVRLPDGTETTVQELVNGNLRYADYTRKRMEAAEAEKQVEAKSAQMREIEQTLTREREQLGMVLQHFLPERPNPSLADPSSPDFDPIAYTHQKSRWDQAQETIRAVMSAHEEAQQRNQHEMAQSQKKRVEEETQRFIEANPEFRDRSAFADFQRSAVETLSDGYGFTRDEINQLDDHRMLMVLRDAIEFRKLKAAAPAAKQKTQGKPPVMTPKRKSSQPNNAKLTDRVQKARQSGDITSVSDIIGELLA